MVDRISAEMNETELSVSDPVVAEIIEYIRDDSADALRRRKMRDFRIRHALACVIEKSDADVGESGSV